MQQKRDLAIVLRTTPFEDRHRIVTALSERHGLITALAKNSVSSRRFGGALDPFVASEWMFNEKANADMVHLNEALVRRAYEGLTKDFEKFSMASAFNELMLKLAPKNEPCPDLFRLQCNALAALEESIEPGADLPLLNGFMAKLLQWSGSQPQLHSCMECDTPADQINPRLHLTCVVTDAGWICPDCRAGTTRHVQERQGQTFLHSSLRVTSTAIVDFHMSLGSPIRQVHQLARASRREHQELFKFLEALFVYHLPGFDQKPLKSLRFLDLESSIRISASMTLV